MLLDLKGLDTGAVFVLLVDELAEMFDDLIDDVVDVSAALGCRYRVDERDLLEAHVRTRDGHFPTLVRLLVDQLDWVVELVHVGLHVQAAVVFEFVHWHSVVIEVHLNTHLLMFIS